MMFKKLMKREEENKKQAGTVDEPAVTQVPKVFQPDDPDKIDEGEALIF